MRCPNCGEAQSSRVKRQGFLQTLILPLFGYFPWECASCRFHHLSHERGLKRRRSSADAAEPAAELLPADTDA